MVQQKVVPFKTTIPSRTQLGPFIAGRWVLGSERERISTVQSNHLREYPSLSWCHFEYFVSRHWFFVQATPTIQQLGKSTLDPPQEWLPLFSHNHGSLKNGYISNRIVTFQIQGPIFRWGRKGRTPSTPPQTPHTLQHRRPSNRPQVEIPNRRRPIANDSSLKLPRWHLWAGTIFVGTVCLDGVSLCLDGVRAVMFFFFPDHSSFPPETFETCQFKKNIYIYVYNFWYSLFDSRWQLRWQRLDILKSQIFR